MDPKSKGATDVLKKRRKWLLMKFFPAFIALALAIPPGAIAAAEQAYPTRPVRLVIPFPPGGGVDTVGRMIATKLSERLGRQVVPDNRGGAGGTIGNEMVAKSAPDGYTLLMVGAVYAMSAPLYKLPYDPVKAFTPVAGLGSGPAVLSVYAGLPATSVKELIALAKKQPGKLIFATSGVGTINHLGAELFKIMTGTDFMIVHFKGGGPALMDQMGGHSQAQISPLVAFIPHLKSGKLRALGVGGTRRISALPDVPTIAEAGVPGYEATLWWGILAPAGTPKAIVDKLHRELAVIMNAEDTKKMFESQGAEADLMEPAEFGKFIEAEIAKWDKVIKVNNIKVED
jgi:tripartite-type tricarboxylate transporter receptor subunit TctC